MSEETEMTAEDSQDEQVQETAENSEDTTGKGWNSATRKRFDEINSRMKEAEANAKQASDRAEALQAKIEELVQQKATETREPLKAPSHLSADEQVEWLISKGAKRAIESELGMSLADAKAVLLSAPETHRQAYATTWNSLCREHGLDPNDEKVITYARGLSQKKGLTPESIVKKTAEIFGKKPSKTTKQPNTMESGAETAVMIAADDMPMDAKSAHRAAKEGRKAPHVDGAEILARQRRARARA